MNNRNRVSVLIPTYNRAKILRKVLRAYAGQSRDHQLLEVVVVDDGSKDDTRSVVRECSESSPLPLRYVYQENSGLSAARNHGIREARGELLLFGDDDIIPGPFMVAEHVSWHVRYPDPEVGVLGLVTWSPEVHPTPFMAWSGLYGPQFPFGYFRSGMELDFRFAYFCNTSVKAAFIRNGGGEAFSEDFRQYGWEDLEFSYRLCQRGYRLLYNPAAYGFHYKYERFADTLRRVEQMYRSWPVFAKTDAGKRFLELQRGQSKHTVGWLGSTRKKLLRPLKAVVMSLLRPFVDTRITLPGWLYDSMFYHYVTPFSTFLSAEERDLVKRT